MKHFTLALLSASLALSAPTPYANNNNNDKHLSKRTNEDPTAALEQIIPLISEAQSAAETAGQSAKRWDDGSEYYDWHQWVGGDYGGYYKEKRGEDVGASSEKQQKKKKVKRDDVQEGKQKKKMMKEKRYDDGSEYYDWHQWVGGDYGGYGYY